MESNYFNQTIAPGFYVAIVLKENIAPEHGYAGIVRATDNQGIRITLLSWLTARFDGHDAYIPWSNIESALVYTPEDDLTGFYDEALDWLKKTKALSLATQHTA